MNLDDNTFIIREGLSTNSFLDSGDSTAHVMLTDGKKGRVYVCFPAGNSGAALPLDFNEESSRGMEFTFLEKPRPFSRGKNDRGISFEVQTNKDRVVFSGIYMDSIRFIRELKAPDRIKSRLHNRAIFLKITNRPAEGYLEPSVSHEVRGEHKILTFTRKTLDDRNTFYAEIRLPDGVRVESGKGGIVIVSENGKPVQFGMACSVDYKPLTPYSGNEILNDGARRFRESLNKNDKVSARRFDEALHALAFLSYREKFLAGSWRFLTYFGRDTMMSLMMLRDCVKREVYESAMGSVLDRVSDGGDAAHEEDIGSQAFDRHIEEYLELKNIGKIREAEAVIEKLSHPVYDYKMVDDNFMLPLMIGEYVRDESIPRSRKKSFLEKTDARGEKNIETLLRNFNLVLKKAEKYTESGDPKDLVRIPQGHMVGDWRDSPMGLGKGVYPGSVNVDFAADSLASVRDILASGLYTKNELIRISDNLDLASLKSILDSPGEMDKHIEAWRNAKKHFMVVLSPEDIRGRLKDYLENHQLPAGEKDYLLSVLIDGRVSVRDFLYEGKIPENLSGGISFYALSLDEDGRPVEVMNSDSGFRLFNGNPPPEEIRGILKTINLPYPLGLAGASGIFTANPVFASDKPLRNALDRNGYHGTVVWAWQMALMEKGFMKQIKRYREIPGQEKLAGEMFEALSRLRDMEKNTGDLVNSELWTYKIRNGKMEPDAYGQEASSETESNPVQLWSAAGLSTMKEYEEVKRTPGR